MGHNFFFIRPTSTARKKKELLKLFNSETSTLGKLQDTHMSDITVLSLVKLINYRKKE